MVIRRTSLNLLLFNPFLSRAPFDTSPPGAFGVNVRHGESAWPDEADLCFLRAHWIIGPPVCLENLVPHHVDLENPFGHDTRRIRVIDCGLDNHCTVRNVCHPGMGVWLLAV